MRCLIFGEQHHQPRVIAAQLQLLYCLATQHDTRITVLMEHFNFQQATTLRAFADTGDAQALCAEYARSSEGFRLTQAGYLPLLNLVRELPNVRSEIVPGFPPREWARLVMRGGREAVLADDAVKSSGLLDDFDRWYDLLVSREHAAYIRASISGQMPNLSEDGPVKQGGLNAAQAFKDSVMAWKADQILASQVQAGGAHTKPSRDVLVVICGSGHCEYGFGVPERIKACSRDKIGLVVTKPSDGGFWQSQSGRRESATDEQAHQSGGRPLADAVIVYEAVDV